MAEGAAERRFGRALPDPMREKVKAFSASADTVGQFFGEDIFVAIGSILLITGFVDTTYHLKLDALNVALWAIPTAICAYVIHGTRLYLLDHAARPDGRSGGPHRPYGPGRSTGGRSMIKVEWFYWLCGAIFLAVAVLTVADRTNAKRYGSGAFWGLLGAAFVYSTFVVHKTAPAWVLGLAVIAMALLVATGRLRPWHHPRADACRAGVGRRPLRQPALRARADDPRRGDHLRDRAGEDPSRR